MKRSLFFLLCLVFLTSCATNNIETVSVTIGTATREFVFYSTVEATKTQSFVPSKGTSVLQTHCVVGDIVESGTVVMSYRENGVEHSLVAPGKSVVSELAVSGTVSDGKKAFAVFVDMDSLTISVLLNEEQVQIIQAGDTATISGNGFAQTSGSARVEHISYVPEDTENGAGYRATLVLEESNAFVLPGMTVEVVLSSELANAAILPYSAVGYDNGYYVYTKTGEKRVLKNAVFVREGYAVEGLESDMKVAKSIRQVEE